MISNESPWLVYLFFENSDEDTVWCSGSVIGSNWILTAASCLDVYRYLININIISNKMLFKHFNFMIAFHSGKLIACMDLLEFTASTSQSIFQ
jgi:hypothetical protein